MRHNYVAPHSLGHAARVQGSVLPPALGPGQERCPVCRNATHRNASGKLRGHRDLFGHKCYGPAEEFPQ